MQLSAAPTRNDDDIEHLIDGLARKPTGGLILLLVASSAPVPPFRSHIAKEWRSEISGEIEVINPSCIKVPSPEEIHHLLFPRDPVTTVSLPPVWTARVLLTPAGGLRDSPIVPSDQLVIGNLIYDASAPSERLMRIRTLFTGKPQLLRLPVQNIRRRDGVVVVDLGSGQTNRLTRQSLWTIRDARRSARSRISCKQPFLACRDLECAWSVARRLFGRLK